jgi:curved DNA-binding protein CbpA
MDRLSRWLPAVSGATAFFSEVAAGVREKFDPYMTLGVPPTATQAEITHAYRIRLRAHHPDTREAPTSDDHLREVLAAYALLRDPARRARYDASAVSSPPVSATDIPITHRSARPAANSSPAPPLWAGPVHRHR